MKWSDKLPVPAATIRANPPKSLSPEWFQSRRGRITASKRAGIVLQGTPENWRLLRQELIHEMSADWEHEDIDSVPMKWGRDHEREALDAIQEALGELTEPGLVLHPDFDFAGATPDGLVGSGITVQVKCPYQSKNHIQTLIDSRMKSEYYIQVQFEAFVTGRPIIIFATYDPRQSAARRLGMIDVPVNENMQNKFADRLEEFRKYLEGNVTRAAKPLTLGSILAAGDSDV